MHEYFSTDYLSARQRFLTAAQGAGAELTTFRCPAKGPAGEELYTDVARLGASTAERILVVMSGVHGVEGFAGSAIQTSLMLQGVGRLLPTGLALLVIHAINPFGFAHLRRVNEDNVDLNRNFVDFSQLPLLNAEYDRLANVIAPQKLGVMSDAALTWRLAGYRLCHGQAALQKAVTCGQYAYPAGLFYGGDQPTWSNRTLRAILAEHLDRAASVAVIDLHTGLGPRGYGEIIIGDPPGSTAFARARDWWGERVRSTAAGESVSSHLNGTVRNAFKEIVPETDLVAAGLEFGTLPAMTVFRAMRVENWLYHQGSSGHPQAESITRAFLQAFSPDDLNWQREVLRQGREVVMAALSREDWHTAVTSPL